MDDSSEHSNHGGGLHKQLSFKEVVEDGIDCQYILRAAECFEEGKSYVRSNNYSCAINKLLMAVQHLITQSPDVDTLVKVNGKDVESYILKKCGEYGEEVSGYCSKGDVVCSLKDFNLKKLQEKLKVAVEESQTDIHIRGVECALLCHIVTILHTCKAALQLEEQATALAEASNRLKKLLYDNQTMKTNCSFGNLNKYFESSSDNNGDMETMVSAKSKSPMLFRGSSDRTELPTWYEKEVVVEEIEQIPSLMFTQSIDTTDADGDEKDVGFFSFAE